MIWTQASVDRIAGINEFSLWDLAWRCKGQQRGMALDPQTEVWHAIYFCSVNHITNGISRYNTDVASGTVLPRLADRLADYSHTAGTLRFTAATPPAADLVTQLLDIRMREIDERSAALG